MPRLRVLAGPALSALVPITEHVNTSRAHRISSDAFDGAVVVNIRGFTDADGGARESGYFEREERRGVTWSIQMQGRFLEPYSADDILFGNVFDRPLKLPWGSGAALSFMSYMDPTLQHDLSSPSKPWALSPLISTMPYFAHRRVDVCASTDVEKLERVSSGASDGEEDLREDAESGGFPPDKSLVDDLSQLHLSVCASDRASSVPPAPTSEPPPDPSPTEQENTASGVDSESDGENEEVKRLKQEVAQLSNAAQRRAYFRTPERRRAVQFGSQDLITTDFCYGFLQFSPTLALRLPGGLSFDLGYYWDGQPVRFVCCARRKESEGESEGKEGNGDEGLGQEPWGRVFWCVSIELAEEEGEEEATGGVEEGDGEGEGAEEVREGEDGVDSVR